jgi:hypothetical protein
MLDGVGRESDIENQAVVLMHIPEEQLLATRDRLVADRAQRDPAVSAYDLLKAALQDDHGYAWSWHCNIAMAIYDSLQLSHRESNLAAAKIMERVFEVDTTVPPGGTAEPLPSPPRNLWEQLNDL